MQHPQQELTKLKLRHALFFNCGAACGPAATFASGAGGCGGPMGCGGVASCGCDGATSLGGAALAGRLRVLRAIATTEKPFEPESWRHNA